MTTTTLIDALQDIEQRLAALRLEEQDRAARLERERRELDMRQLLIETAHLMRYGTWHPSKQDEVAAVKRRLQEAAA